MFKGILLYLFLLLCACIPFHTAAQNAPPSVQITNVILDEGSAMITVEYDLIDPTNDLCTVMFSASQNNSETFLADVTTVTGAIGNNIAPASGLSISWNYTGIPSLGSVIVKVVAYDDNTPDIQEMVDQVTEQIIQDRLGYIAIPRNHVADPDGLQAVRDSIWNTFSMPGFQRSSIAVPFGAAQADNVVGRKPGCVNEASTFIVDAHYDAVANVPGADDNATGVVATMSIARILSQYNFKNSLRFLGFSVEEQGLIGSQHYVLNSIPAWEQINGVLNMEMIGFYSDEPNSQEVPQGFNILFPDATTAIEANENRGDFLTVVGNVASQALINSYLTASSTYVSALRTIALAAPGNSEIVPDLRRSDHAVFWDSGRQALMLTDGSNFRNPNYHTVNDAIATIDIPFLTNCTKATLAAAALLAEPINAGMDTASLPGFTRLPERYEPSPLNAVVAPNPAHDMITVQLPDHNGKQIFAELVGLSGKTVYRNTFQSTIGNGIFTFSVEDLPTGSYLLKLSIGTRTTTLKVEVN
ncbi:MAG: M28 family peptidase [Flavobacteriales bacterium]|nr:M28 family peptidase [Flavobacteriales bacterium]